VVDILDDGAICAPEEWQCVFDELLGDAKVAFARYYRAVELVKGDR
jgi:hypothetical protein